MSQFTAPATSSNSIKPADLENHLLIIEPTEHKEGITTSMGVSDAIAATIHDITTQETHTDVLLFSKILVGSLKSKIGEKVLGYMSKGTAKPGQSAPWIIQDATTDPEAVKAATEYLTSRTAATLTSPTPAAAPQVIETENGGIELTPELLAALGNLTGK